jgi:hypothetical protein
MLIRRKLMSRQKTLLPLFSALVLTAMVAGLDLVVYTPSQISH